MPYWKKEADVFVEVELIYCSYSTTLQRAWHCQNSKAHARSNIQIICYRFIGEFLVQKAFKLVDT
jgi:hypothetical protein